MSKRMTAIAATALALAFGCEGMGGEREAEPIGQEEQARQERQEEQALREQPMDEQARVQREQEQPTQFNQEPGVDLEEEEPLAQGPDARMRQQQHGQQQMGQQGQPGQQQQLGQAQMAGQLVTMPSERNFNQTISQLQRQMRQNDLELVGQIRYDEQARQRVMRQQQGQQAQQGEQAQQGQQAQGEIGDVRLLVFRHPNAEMMSIEQQGAEALLDAPRTVLVYERGGDVIVAYRAPREMAAIGTEEPTSELLSRVVRGATQSGQQPTAAAETEGEPIARGDVEDVEVRITEDERQARAGGQQGDEAQN